jgi:hypothetical protein
MDTLASALIYKAFSAQSVQSIIGATLTSHLLGEPSLIGKLAPSMPV